MSIQYDAQVIRTFAGKLYDRAEALIVLFTLCGMVAGAVPGVIFVGGLAGFIVGLGAGGCIGFLVGQQRAFHLKLQAQVALCQVQIEENTRIAAAISRQAPTPAVRADNSNAA